MNKIIVLKEYLKTIEKDLYKANTGLKDFNSFLSLINLICSNVNSVNKLINSDDDSNNELKHLMQKEIKNKKLIPLFNKFFTELNEKKLLLDELQEPALKANLFFEGYRNYRDYKFNGWDSLAKFLTEITVIYSIKELSFKPEFHGSINLMQLAKELELHKSNQQLIINNFDLEKLIKFFSNNFKPFYLTTKEIKLRIKNNYLVQAEARNSIIKRLDRLAIEFDGSYFEK